MSTDSCSCCRSLGYNHIQRLPRGVFSLLPRLTALSVQHCQYSTVSTALSVQHCQHSTVSTALSVQHCQYSTVSAALSVQHCQYSTVSTALSVQHCQYSTVSTAIYAVPSNQRCFLSNHVPEISALCRAISTCIKILLGQHVQYSIVDHRLNPCSIRICSIKMIPVKPNTQMMHTLTTGTWYSQYTQCPHLHHRYLLQPILQMPIPSPQVPGTVNAPNAHTFTTGTW